MMSQVSLELRACPICLTRSRSRRFAEANIHWEALDHYAFASRKLPEYMHWRLSRCLDCDLLYADPAPSPDDLARLYEEAGFDSRKEAHHASRTYGRLLSRIVGRLPERKGAADIGTGDGAFLAELLDQGFEDVEGIEPSMAPIEAADASVRPLIRHGVFRADSFAAESKSLITCFQTIEHLSDPLSFCRHAWRCFRPGGAIFLIGHNHRAISAKILGASLRSSTSNTSNSFLRQACAVSWAPQDSFTSRPSRFSIAIRWATGQGSSRFRIGSSGECWRRWRPCRCVVGSFPCPRAISRRSHTNESPHD